MSYDSELDCAVRAADAAGAILREAFHDSRASGLWLAERLLFLGQAA